MPHQIYLITFCLLLLTCCATTEVSQAQESLVRTPSGIALSPAALDSIISSAVLEAGVPGLSIAIVNGDRIVYANTFGVVNQDTQEPVDSNTLFEAASLSKPFFAYFVLKMVDRGLLDLDKPLFEYLPHPTIAEGSREAYKKITARMVLSHSTGFPNHAEGKPIELAFAPGQGFSYSGAAYQYLATIIADLRSVDLQEGMNPLIRKEVAEPLKMRRSTFINNNFVSTHKAYGHDQTGNPIERDVYRTFEAYSGLHSDAKEYANFLIALLKGQGLSPDTYSDMLAEHTHFDVDNPLLQQVGQTGWGLGLAQKPSPYGTMHLHTGNNPGFRPI